MSTFKQITLKYGVTNIAKYIGVSNEMVNKSVRKKYAPADWYHRLVSIMNGQITYDDLYHDLYVYKLNYKPEVVNKSIGKFIQTNSKIPTKAKKS
jgi:hypothetical protein